ncbi:phosphoribosylanthranilate isomerase [Mangrovicella endophytica]|uniref:phosphoribosylanthranilate isomerase n=1 Tax=Mangrovicella endophytica TaxID=2066697 RepID=UPI000C9E1C93|nr:phosphoribosylanthranilate isomerase [Mangrovicella endophytica]
MEPVDVKICGLSGLDAIEAALARGATQIGFVHFPASPRHLSLEAMAALRQAVGARAETVVVTVDPDDALVDAIATTVQPDWLQLHGSETPERVAEVARRSGLKIMKALPVAVAADLSRVPDYAAVADRVLLDAKRPKGAVLPGGNGVAFDWSLLGGLDPSLAYVLSGGLDAANVGVALSRIRPFGIDVSSGVESAPGVKSVDLIHRFFDVIDAARSLGPAQAGVAQSPAAGVQP